MNGKIFFRSLSSATAAVTKIHRAMYTRRYKTLLVNPDGSSSTIYYHEPRKIITLPLNLSEISEEERLRRLAARKPRQKVKIVDDFESDFDARKYLQFVKKVKK